ncbi:MAG: SRPBCC family protein [Rhodothermales bacterium]|nr:SRPBCC family protein [Rhodothermales bacterium]
MKYDFELEILAPRDRVIELFDNPQNPLIWQPTLLRFEHLSGEPGQPGSTSRLVYRRGSGEFEIIETITARNLPDSSSGTYDTNVGTTLIQNRFVDHGESTIWQLETDYTPGGIMRLLFPFMRGMIEKQTRTTAQQFKAFVEMQPANGGSIEVSP